MDVGAIGGVGGAMGMAGMGSVAPAGALAIGPAGLAGTSAAGLSGMQGLAGAVLTPQLQNLVQSLTDFSSAEILLALMMMNAGNKEDKKCSGSGSSAALGLLVGMSLAAQVGQMFGNLAGGLPGVGDVGASGMGGSTVNFQV